MEAVVGSEAKSAVNANAATAAVKKDSTIDLTRPNGNGKNGVGLSGKLDTFTVVKRNGMLVPFRRDRVFTAIEAAFRHTKEIPITAPLPQEVYSQVQSVASEVIKVVDEQARLGACLTVEGIQDIVEMKLMQGGFHDVGRNYIVYREEHKQIREDSPRNLKIFRRDGTTQVRFNPMKIASAIERAFRASLKIEGTTPQDVIDSVNLFSNKVVQRVVQLSKAGTALHVELIQDEVERQMMAEGFYQVAKDFIIYRSQRALLRAREEVEAPIAEVAKEAPVVDTGAPGREFQVTAPDGKKYKLTEGELRRRVTYACRGFEDRVSGEDIVQEAMRNFYDGVRTDEVDTSCTMAARAKVEKEPAYSFVAARLLLDIIYRETLQVEAVSPKLEAAHREYFKKYLTRAIEVERVDPALLNFDLEKIASAMKLERDLQFTYLGLQTLYDRYLIHHEDVRLETPQIFWMRVSMGLALNEGAQKTERAIEFYNVLSRFLFTSSTPTLFNSGTLHPQMSSCYLSTVQDDLKSIFKIVSDDAQLSKWAGGLGNDWTNIRATGSRIKGTNGRSQGVIPFLKVANDTAVAVNQGGKRKGAMCAYLETWHLDMEDFLELRKNTGDERRRTHDMNTANWIPDLFMKRVAQNGTWTLFSPSDVPDLHDLYGSKFEERYTAYEKMTETGELKLFKKIEAVTIWRKMLSFLFETGHPWMTFKDPSNLRSPQDHCGVVHSSNLCTEILLNTSADETAVCNLGSVNLVAHVSTGPDSRGFLDEKLIAATVKTAVRMLDNVIDINFYPTVEAKTANLRHRPIGLGLMGFQDALYKLNFSYASPEAVRFADESMEVISYYAILASTELARERGSYSTFKGSKWDRGLLPIDTIRILQQERGADYLDMDTSATLDWSVVREAIKKNGMRNSNTMAIAPTATISNITGVTQSIEPSYKHLYAKSNLSGEFTVQSTFLVEALKKLGMWDDEMIDDLKYFDGSIMEIERIPENVKRVFLTAFEIEPEWLIECGSRRQKWIDMGQSLNLYIAEPSGKKLHDMYMLAWKKGLKTTYYLRSLGATQIEKSTTDVNKRGLQPRWMKNKSASSNIKVERSEAAASTAPAASTSPAMPKAMCSLDGDCESCQ
ncbi:MAG: ribonucleoside-diphosphate reductase subunit alpha [Deltaproteobacteria bacterium]|nr:ribonucleoside-diphosphate reductase subunit alpha [Deltaproteobacteria bacterium]